MNDFSKVKIGDRLWSVEAGWVVVDITNPTESTTLYVRTSQDKYKEFDMRGRPLGYPDYPQSLFFEEMTLSPVPKPIEQKPFDPNKPYGRRDGMDCKIVHTTKEGKFVVVATEDDSVYCCYENGRYLMSAEHPADLVNIPEKIQGWMNIYKNNKIYANKAAADIVGYDRIACKFISYFEGEGL